jgi:hypothetical protein
VRRAAIAGLTIVALGCTASTVAARPEAAARPALKMIKRVPLTLRGTNFEPAERVRITAAGRNWRLRARPRGTFVVVMRGIDRCDTVRVIAVGDEGSRTILKILPSPACAAA